MLPLHELQRQFSECLSANNNVAAAFIKSTQRLTAQEHLTIYRNSVLGALQKVLKEIYPVCHKLVGKDFFIVMINDYIQQTSSISPDIGDYGYSFAEFIEHFAPAKSLPYLADVARLEWAWHKIFSAPESTELDFLQLQECIQTSGDRIVFRLASDSFLLSSSFPIHRIWAVNQDAYSGDQTILLKDNEKFYYFVWRHGLEMHIDELSFIEWQCLTSHGVVH